MWGYFMDWRTAELAGYQYYSAKGYRILVSLVHSDTYDFVAEKEGTFLKVNVKVAGLKTPSNPNSWSISKSGSQKASVHYDCDVYLVWLPHKEQFIELSGDFFDGTKSKSRQIPVKLTKNL